MSDQLLSQKQLQFNEFFSIEHKFNVNVELLASEPSFEEFLASMPTSFRLASDIVALDHAALRPLNQLDSVAALLVDYLNHQSKKIDLLLGFVLSQQDKQEHRYNGIRFGGGGIVFQAEQGFEAGQMIELKIFFPEQNVAIFCVGEIFESELMDNSSYNHKVILQHIRDDDRELLVRTSLHIQSKQLQQLAAQRRKE